MGVEVEVRVGVEDAVGVRVGVGVLVENSEMTAEFDINNNKIARMAASAAAVINIQPQAGSLRGEGNGFVGIVGGMTVWGSGVAAIPGWPIASPQKMQ